VSDAADLIPALLGDEGYASGRRAFPRTVSLDAAVELAGLAQAEVDRGADARAAAAEREGIAIACGRGCNACCEEMVLTYDPEAERIARWLEAPENAEVRAGFLSRYPAWKAAVGDAPARLADRVAAGDSAGYEAAHVAQWRRRILCAFNQDGDCAIYPVRPVNCRNAHAIETAERCAGDHPSGRGATRLAFKPLDDFLRRVRQLERAAHHALGGALRRPEALPDAVHRRLR
jgi:Fe-S-cluster containining protein